LFKTGCNEAEDEPQKPQTPEPPRNQPRDSFADLSHTLKIERSGAPGRKETFLLLGILCEAYSAKLALVELFMVGPFFKK